MFKEKFVTSVRETDLLLNFLQHQATTKQVSGDWWMYDADRTAPQHHRFNEQYPYDLTFEPLLNSLGFSNFKDLVQARLDNGRSAFVLELFGSGKFIAETGIPSGVLGIRLKDVGDNDNQSARPDWWKVLEGNIYNLYPERHDNGLNSNIEQFMMGQRITGFDFIICRPLGPFQNSETNHAFYEDGAFIEIYYYLLSRFYQLLSADNGMIFTQVPILRTVLKQDLDNFQHFLRSHGFAVVFTETDSYLSGLKIPIMLLTKSSQSPTSLPAKLPCLKITR